MFRDVDKQLSVFYFQILKSSKRDMTEIIFEGSAPMEQEGLFAYAANSGSRLTESYVTRPLRGLIKPLRALWGP